MAYFHDAVAAAEAADSQVHHLRIRFEDSTWRTYDTEKLIFSELINKLQALNTLVDLCEPPKQWKEEVKFYGRLERLHAFFKWESF